MSSRGRVGMICLIVAEASLFAVFVVAYLFYLGKSLTGPFPRDVLSVPVLGTVCLLSSSVTVALGARTPGVMGSDEFRDRVAEISQGVGENGWPMPLPEELKDDLKSTVADLANVSGSRYAGMLVAGTYLREFVADGGQWAHIDIAAPAYNTGGPWGYTGKGGTGVPTRTMFAVLEDIAASG